MGANATFRNIFKLVQKGALIPTVSTRKGIADYRNFGITARASAFKFLSMALTKRKRSESDDDSASLSFVDDEQDVDISPALTGDKTRIVEPDDSDDEDELADFIRSSIAKRSIKEGTRIVKKSKGKVQISKGEVGGGSFQSMGMFKQISNSFIRLHGTTRSSSISPPLPNPSRLQTTYSNPTSFNSIASHQPSTRPRRNGTHRLREISRLPRSARATSRREALIHIWS